MPSWLRPRSVYQLVLVALVMVALPLLAVVITAIVKVDTLAADSNTAGIQADHIAPRRAALGETLSNMERSARQYRILHDTHMHDNYLETRRAFLDAAAQLQPLQPAGLDELLAQEQRVHDGLERSAFTSDDALQESFADLSVRERQVASATSAAIIDMADAFHDAARKLK